MTRRRLCLEWLEERTLPVITPSLSFGVSVAISGDTAVLGEPTHTVAHNTSQGAVFVYTLSGSTWSLQQELTADDGQANDQFGLNVAISGDTVVVGDNPIVSAKPLVYVFTRSGTTWTQQQELTSTDAGSLALDGDTLVVGSPDQAVGSNEGQGSAYVFTRSGTTWNQQQELTDTAGTPFEHFGSSVAVSGSTVVVGDAAAGAAYVFTLSGTTWSQQQELPAADGAGNDLNPFYGDAVAISGQTIVVAAPLAERAYVFTLNGTMDLLTALTHEMGHELGLPDQTTMLSNLMFNSLLPGIRKSPSLQKVDAAFAALGHGA